ncbi:hypothetical protein C0J52_22826 [Blattella germanica]|nr:hypothetical protein C0J52_22826 [Blattella germanica]
MLSYSLQKVARQLSCHFQRVTRRSICVYTKTEEEQSLEYFLEERLFVSYLYIWVSCYLDMGPQKELISVIRSSEISDPIMGEVGCETFVIRWPLSSDTHPRSDPRVHVGRAFYTHAWIPLSIHHRYYNLILFHRERKCH